MKSFKFFPSSDVEVYYVVMQFPSSIFLSPNDKTLGMEFVVPFPSPSCSLALKLSWKKNHQMTPFFIKKEVSFEWSMAMFSLKWKCFHLKSLMTWEWDNENERKKEPCLNQLKYNMWCHCTVATDELFCDKNAGAWVDFIFKKFNNN